MDNTFTDSNSNEIGKKILAEEGIEVKRAPLETGIDDKDFIKIARKLIKDSETFYDNKYNLKERRKKNEVFLWGQQLREKKLKNYNSRFNDNIIYEGMAYLKPIALARMPDVIVAPGDETQDQQKSSESLTKVIDTDIKNEKRRKVLAMAFKHLPVYFVGAIKPFWNTELNDYDFRVVHPNNLVLDHTAADNNPDNMSYIAEYVEYSVKELIMRFPEKEQELIKELKLKGIFQPGKDETTESGMNSKLKITEIWFTWYEKAEGGYTRTENVGWFYEDCVLGKMKDPNFDWKGTEKLTFNEQPVTPEQLQQAILTGDMTGINREQIFNNYFQHARKPYILLNYDQWGKVPIDETSIIEQAISMQDEHDKRGKQISEMLDRSRGKHIFSTDSGLKKEDIEELDMADPDTDLLVDGQVGAVHGYIQGEQPSAAAFNNLATSEARIFAKMGVNGAVRGQPEGNTATTNQIARESDFTRADDLAEETINHAAREMSEWILQFIKLRYTEDHFKKSLGEGGKVLFTRLHQDLVSDGMEVTITASGVDKLKAKQQAMDMAKLKMIDPMSFYKDLGISDPKGRTERMMLFTTDPQGYMAKYVMDMQNTAELAAGLDANTDNGGLPVPAPVPPVNPAAVGPVSGNPQPGDTSQINIEPPQATTSMV